MNKIPIALGLLFLLLPLASSITGSIGNSVIIAEAEPGGVYRDYILIRNSNAFPVDITLTPASGISDKIEFDEDSFNVEQGQDKRAYFELSSDEEGTFSGNVDVKFEGNGEERTISAIISFVVAEGSGDEDIAEIAVQYDPADAVEGEELIVIIEITNLQNESAVFEISAEDYESWAELTDTSEDSIEIPSGDTEEAIFTFIVNEDAEGEQSFTVHLTSGDKEQSKEIFFDIEGREDENNELEGFIGSSQITFQGNVGANFNGTIRIKNVNEFPISVNLSTLGNVMIIDKSFELQPGQEVNARFNGTINDVGTKEIVINVAFNSPDQTVALPFKIIVTGGQNLRADAAYIVKNLNGVDTHLLSYLRSIGYTYETIQEHQVSGINLDEFRFVIIGNQDLNSPGLIPIEKHKTLVINSYNYYKKSSTKYQLGWSSAQSYTTSPKMDVINVGSPITIGVPKEFNAYTTTSSKIYRLKGQKPAGTVIEASTASLSTDAVVASLDKGKRFLNGKTIEERQVFFGIVDARYWTADSKKLFDNSIKWLLVGEDRDGDGYFSDVDCNDNNALVNPGAQEIAYDGLDNDCNGGDLKDVDGDGFNAKITGGLDCDDEDALINPNNPDPYLNCVNDAPIADEIENITISESESAIIVVSAEDPENDDLTYSIDDSRFSANENVFTWETGFEDEGDYEFTVTVSDSEFSVEKEAKIKVTRFNRAPVLSEIETLEWLEDENYEINLNAYFIDEDGDSLTFGINESDNDINIELIGEGVFRLSAGENWNGQGEIAFYASDGDKKTNTNVVELSVIPVNDRVEFKGKISDIIIDEDSELEDAINLYDYFEDVDNDELEFNVEIKVRQVDVVIENGIVSFYPKKDFSGAEEIRFRANDSEYSEESNTFKVTVNEKGEAPELQELRCLRVIDEDKEYDCEIAADDFENDEITFEVRNEENVECTIIDNKLHYKSEKDHNGEASCEIAAKDKDGEDMKKLEVDVTPVNDAPRIISSAPAENSVLIIEGRDKTFSVKAEDIDSVFSVIWKVNGETKKQEINKANSSYVFKQDEGFHMIEVIVSDGEFEANNVWSAIVGDTSQFTCSEVGGFILDEDSVCTGDMIPVSDTGLCCSVRGAPGFKDADACEAISQIVSVEITSPDTDDDITLGDDIRVNVKIENDLEEDQDFDIEAHLYNLNRDRSESSNDVNLDVESKRSGSTRIDLEIPSDLDLDDDYVLFVKADDNECSQTYQEIRLERSEDNVEITEFEIPEILSCGSESMGRIRLENLGSEDKDVDISIENNLLNIEENDNIELEEFGEDDKETREFVISIPEDAESGEYSIVAAITYEGGSERETRDIEIECPEEISEVNPSLLDIPQGIVRLNSKTDENTRRGNPVWVLPAFVLVLVNLILIALILASANKTKKKRQREKANIELLKKRVFQAE